MRVLITGAGRGIGAALARRLAADGHEVIGTVRGTPPDGWLACDVADPASVTAMAQAFGARPLDLLVCNAGVYLDKGHALDTGYDADLWARTFAVNVTGVFLTVQALLPNLRAARGKVAVISSQMGSSQKAGGGGYIYRASKAAATNLALNLAADLRGDGIAVGAWHPGWVQTDMGGAAADVTAVDAADGLAAEFARLSLETTGSFRTWDGRDHPV
ncbi:SDR family NAD(P)-dependent oxidoreductase [Rhodobacteraceae bacterium CCMM004]|nr:SDR family NAD(P)-dependent oxidoreductase [Rhodobacteraceae bacterium CCMM004]